MPCRPSPCSLRQLCLNSVAANLELMCYGQAKGTAELMDIIESDAYKSYPSPFSEWPSVLLKDLGDAVYRNRAGLKHLLYQIIHPQITTYKIQLHGSLHVALDLVSRRCGATLRDLSLTYSVNLPPAYYCDFFRKLPALRSLDLTGSMVDDLAFAIVANTCPHLRQLNAARTWITDAGLRALCFARDGLTQLTTELTVLDVSETRVTPAGIATFLATHPAAVNVLHEANVISFKILEEQKRLPPDSIYSLTSLSATTATEKVSPSSFSLAVERCPLAESVSVTSPGLRDEHIYCLMNLSNLTSLHLGNNHSTNLDANLTFAEGVAPVLVACGEKLRRLVLERFSLIDVSAIGRSCPRLRHLAVAATGAFVPLARVQRDAFTELTALEVWNADTEAEIGDAIVRQLMENAPLERFLLQSVASLTDQLFYSLLEDNPMLGLRNAVFDRCHNITVASVWKLMQVPNRLAVLRCWSCKSVSAEDKDVIKLAVAENNFTLYWEWFPFTPGPDDVVMDDEARHALMD